MSGPCNGQSPVNEGPGNALTDADYANLARRWIEKQLAAVRAATIVAVYGLPKDAQCDLEQEALLELWRKQQAYDPRRGSWRTFSERVVANRMTSLVRAMRSKRSGQFREAPIENVLGLAAPGDSSSRGTVSHPKVGWPGRWTT